MELLDRYLHAVGFWLPRKQKEDILAELSEDLRSQIEEKEAELGRKLTECDLEALLKQRGRPVLVANHYLPQQYLIGPTLFPIYRFVLGIVALCYLVPWVLVAIGLMVFDSSYRARQIHDGWFAAVLSLWSSWWMVAFVALGVVTIVFAVLERVNAKSRFLEEWEPRKLPEVRDPNRIPRTSSGVEVGLGLAFCIWWIYVSPSTIISSPSVRILLSPSWPYFYWGCLLVTLLNLSLSAVNIVRPYWTRLRAVLRLLSDAAGSALFCWIMKAHLLVGIAVANVPAERAAQIANAINLWAARMFPVALIVAVAILVRNVYRIVRIKPAAPGIPLAVKTSGLHTN